MFKKLKKFIKNKKGDFAIFAIIVIPAMLTIFISAISITYRTTAIESKVQTSVDNISLIASKYYSNALTTNNEPVCMFTNDLFSEGKTGMATPDIMVENSSAITNKNSFEYLFSEYLRTIDGYNTYWKGRIQVEQEENGNETLRIYVYYIFPKVANNMTIIDRYGTAATSSASGWTNWYGQNSETWSKLSGIIADDQNYLTSGNDINKWNKINQNEFITGVIISETSCL